MSKKTKWKYYGSNLEERDQKSEEYKKYRKNLFNFGLTVDRMKPNKPKKMVKKVETEETEETEPEIEETT